MFAECRHIQPTGYKCRAAALRGTPYCYFHTSLYQARNPSATDSNDPISLPSIEDHRGVQIALQQVLGALGSSRLDPRRAGLYIRGLQLAIRLATTRFVAPPQYSVRDLVCQNNGDSLAPETNTCEPPEDCLKCLGRDECENFENYEDDVKQLEESAADKESETAEN